MKIGITCFPLYGGSGVVATELGKALATRGHEIHFISSAMPFRLGMLSERIFFHEVGTMTYPLFETYSPYTLALTSKMVDVARHEGLDVLHVHYAIPHATSAVLARDILASKGLRVPVVTTLHGTDITLVGQDPTYKPVVEYSINQSDAVTAVSDYLRRETHAHFDVPGDIDVIPNFVDTVRFRPMNKGHFRAAIAPGCEKVMVHVSNFRPVKRTADTVEVLARLREMGVCVMLLLVGDGPDRRACEERARELGVHDRVRFLGKQDPVEEILAVADLFLMPSGSETFGLAALEAMACGVPVVSTDIGGLPELVIDGETGLLAPLGDVDAQAMAAARILSDDALHARMAEACVRRAHDVFGLDAVIPMYEAVYDAVVSGVRV
ncbi:MAG: N-acetyl-alpha-D-glucosaminyl L-malate synthase BshA [Bacteroidetes bacterium]|nr:N-acetyl-alpha-D-glucosaminyl L-malate synthase BshA [Bacteroidota bacterium]